MPSPIADFIRRERDGSTLIGGYTCKNKQDKVKSCQTGVYKILLISQATGTGCKRVLLVIPYQESTLHS